MLFGYRNRIRRVKARLIGSGPPSWSSAACCTSSSSSPTTPGGSCPREMDYTWFQLGLLAVLARPDRQPHPEHAQRTRVRED